MGTNGGKALLYLSQDVVKRLAADSSQHGLCQDGDNLGAAVSTVCLRMGTTWRQQSTRSVSGCEQVAGSSQHGLSQDVDK